MPPRGPYRGIYSALLDDPDFQQLTPYARLVFYTARCCEACGPACIFRYYLEVLSRQSGLAGKDVRRALTELQAAGWIVVEEPVLWIKNGLRYDPTFRLADPKHEKAVMNKLVALPKLQIVLTFCDYYSLVRPFGDPSETHRRGVPQDKEKETETGDRNRRPIPKQECREPTPSGLVAETAPAAPAPVLFQISETISRALDRCRLLGQAARLRDPRWWQAEIRANSSHGVDYPGELLRAEAWLATNPHRAPRKDYARFMHSWLSRAGERNGDC